MPRGVKDSSCRTDGVGAFYVADFFNHTIRKGVPAPRFTRQPEGRTAIAGTAVVFGVIWLN